MNYTCESRPLRSRLHQLYNSGYLHRKLPFAVVGGVLAIPTYEESGTKAAQEAEKDEVAIAEGLDVRNN